MHTYKPMFIGKGKRWMGVFLAEHANNYLKR